MPTNEEGEFELVLGNKQLLSVFFIVVVLLGVFFAMGYIVGRHTTPVTEMASNTGGESPVVVEPPNAAEPAKPSPSEPATPASAASTPPEHTAAPPPVEPPKSTAPVTPPPAKPVAPAPAPAKPAPTTPRSGPPAGAYLQVIATRPPEAQQFADVLSKRGFSTYTMPVPDSSGDTVRVLVGPLDNDQISKTRADLEAAGWKSFVQRIR